MTACFRGRPAEHPLHAGYLGTLIDTDIVGKFEYRLVPGGSRSGEQLLDHADRTLVVLDHERQEQPVELAGARLVELPQLVRGEHPRHLRVPVMMTGT